MPGLGVLGRAVARRVGGQVADAARVQQLRRRRREHDPAGRRLLDQRLPQHPVLEAVALREAPVVAVAVAGEEQRHVARPDATVASLPALDPRGVDLRALALGACWPASSARRSSTTAGPISALSGNSSPVWRPWALPRAPGMLTPGGGMKCGGKSICVPVCSVISYALTAAILLRTPPLRPGGVGPRRRRNQVSGTTLNCGWSGNATGYSSPVVTDRSTISQPPLDQRAADRRRGRAGLRRPGFGRACRRRGSPGGRPAPAPLRLSVLPAV